MKTQMDGCREGASYANRWGMERYRSVALLTRAESGLKLERQVPIPSLGVHVAGVDIRLAALGSALPTVGWSKTPADKPVDVRPSGVSDVLFRMK